MRVVTALGLLALAAVAVQAQSSVTATVTNVPAVGERVTFALDNNMPMTGAISLTDAGTSWVVYGTSASIAWYNSSCVMQGLPSEATWSATGCFYSTPSAYPVTSLVKTGANTFVAIANDTITMYSGMTVSKTLSAPGSTFDMAMTQYPTFSGPAPMPTVWNNFLYIGSYNVNMTGMSALRKIDLSTGAVSWTAWTPNYQSNYPVSIVTLSNGATMAVAQSANYQTAIFAPFDDSTGAMGNATLSTAMVEGNTGCSTPGVGGCNWVQFGTASINGIFYIASTPLNYQLIAVDFTTGFYATVYSGISGSGSIVVQAFGTWLFVGKGQTVTLVDTTKIPVTALTKTGGPIPSAAYNSNSLSLRSFYYTPMIQAVMMDNKTNTFWMIHSAGISTASLAMFTAGTTTYATVWWWYWTPYQSTSYGSIGNLQGAWVDSMNPTMLYVTYGKTSNGVGSSWAFNTSSQWAVWNFADNYDARGPAIWVPSNTVTGMSGLWFGVANAATSVYGRRVLLAWAADSTGAWGKVMPNVAAYYYSTWSSDTMHLSYSNVSGLLAVVAPYPTYTFTLYNATTLMPNATYPSTSINFRPSFGVITVGTWHCCSSYSNLYCLDWTTGVSASFPYASASNSISGNLQVVGNRYIIASDRYYTVSVMDTMAKTPAFVALSVSSASGYIAAQSAGWINTDGTLVVAVPMSGATCRVFYGIDGTTFVDVTSYTVTSGSSASSFNPTFTSNAIAFGGFLWAAGNLTTAYVSTSSTSVQSSYTGQITRIPLSTPAVAKTVTKAQASLWVWKGTSAVGTIKNLFASPMFPTMLFTLGDTFTAWDATSGNTYFSVAPLATMAFYTASNQQGNYDYFPTVDPTTRGVIVGMSNVSNGVFMGYSILDPLHGTLIRFIGVPATSATGLNWQPQSTPRYNGNTLVMGSTHMCDYSTLNAWNTSVSPSTTNYFDARTCTTTDGLSPSYGYVSIGNWYFTLLNGMLLQSSRAPQAYQSWSPFTIGGAPGGIGGNAPADDSSKTPIIIGIIVAVVIIAVVGFVVVKKMSGGGSSSAGGNNGVNYNEMGNKV